MCILQDVLWVCLPKPKSCLSCFREFRELGTMRGRLGVLAEQPLPAGALDGFVDEVMARIAVGEPGPAAEPPRAAPRQTILSLPRLATAAAALLVAFAGLRAIDDGGAEVPRDERASSRLAGTVADSTWQGLERRIQPGPGPIQSGPLDPAGAQLPAAAAGLPTGSALPSDLDVLILRQGGHLPLTTPPAGLELDETRQRRERH